MPDFREPHHLPKVRGDEGADPRGLPRQRRGTTPQLHGRYPDYDVLAQQDHWDEATRQVVLDRVERVPPRRFFDEREEETLSAFADVLLHQDAEPRVPVLRYVDEKLAAGRLEGYQYADLPDDRETWRLVARGLDESAAALGAGTFAAAGDAERAHLVDGFAEGRLSGGAWEQVGVAHAWKVVTRDLLSAFYAHPWAWNEIGFGGPAYPRGYARLGIGLSEEWEGEEAFAVDPVADVKRRGLES